MAKGKKGRRLKKAQVEEMLEQLFSSHPDKTYSYKEIFRTLGFDTHPAKMLAIDTIDTMTWDDFLTKVSDNAYRLNTAGQVQEGTFQRKANGKNSILPDGNDGKPIFVAERNSLWALTGDRVRFSFMARRRQHIKEAQVIEILERAKDTFVGKLSTDHDLTVLITPENNLANSIIIPRRRLKGGKDGDKAVVRIKEWPDADHRNMIGEVVDILGPSGDNDVEMNTILAQYGLPYRYPKTVEEAAEKISGEITPEDMAGREDFRQTFTCTIDPKDAKDFDDALSIKALPGGLWEVGVHIADVSHYVTEGSIIDREAQRRATSVYLVDRTIPMLPERLCNYICSLRPEEEKLAYSVIFTLDDDAQVRASRIVHTVIRSDRRYAYEEVQALLEDNGVTDGTGQPAPPAPPTGYKGEHATELITLDRLAKRLRAKRFKNGAVKFDREELHFDVDEKGKPVRCYFKRSKDANKLIEEFMLLANRTVAESVGKVKKGRKPKTLPYRVHDNPNPQKLETLRQFIGKFGYKLKTEGTKSETARSINSLMDACTGHREQGLIQIVALRAMQKATYTTHNIGHFGLAFDYYTHFTSPIRRYPDTIVHRLLTRYANGGRSANQNHCEELCRHASEMEIVAANAERDSIKFKAVEFMSERVGNVYDAHISGIQSYGIYCEIDENHCEGLVPMRDLDDDYYDFDERNYCLVGRRHHNKYQLGDPIRIKVAQANIEKKQLDFTLADTSRNKEAKGTAYDSAEDKKAVKDKKAKKPARGKKARK